MAKHSQNETKQDTGDEIDAALAKILVESPAQTNQQIAALLGLSVRTVSRRRGSIHVKALVSAALTIQADEIQRLTRKALNRTGALLDDPDPRIALAAAGISLRLAESFGVVRELKPPQVEQPEVIYETCWGENTENGTS